MSDELDDQRTFDPTPRRRQRAREAGDVARSPALASAASWLIGLLVLRWSGTFMVQRISDWGQTAWRSVEIRGAGATAAASELQQWLAQALWLMLPLLLALLASIVAAHVLQAGWLWLPDRLALRGDRLSGAQAWERVTSGETWRSAVRDGVQLVAGLSVVGWRAWSTYQALPALAARGPKELVAACCLEVIDTGLGAGLAWLLVGVVDYALQWRRREARLRMTPQEAREEAKEDRRPRRALPQSQKA